MLNIEKNWNYGQPEKTRALFLAALEPMSSEKNSEDYLQLLTQIARTYSLQAEFQTAHDYLDKVKAQLEQTTPLVQSRYFLERGRTFNSAKQKPQAMESFEKALTLSQEHHLDFYAVDALHMLAIAAPSQDQIVWNEKAIAAAEASEDKRARNWLGSLCNNLGWTYHELGNYPKALSLFEKTVQWHTEKQTQEGLVIAMWSVGRVLRSMKDYEKALQKQEAVIKARQDMKLPEGGYAYEEMAENLLALKRKEEATPYFKKAYGLLSQDTWLQKNESARLERLKNMFSGT